MYDTPTTSHVGGQASPNANKSPSLVLDAARTFIKRPTTKRRSLENMSTFKKMKTTYADLSSDHILQEVMRTFEEIPIKVQGYPQMRKDIRLFLEMSSDRCQRHLFELSERMKSLEGAASGTAGAAVAATPPVRDEAAVAAAPPIQEGAILAKLNKLDTDIHDWIKKCHDSLKEEIETLDKHGDQRGANVTESVCRVIEETQADSNKKIEGLIKQAQSQTEDLVGTAARDIVVETKTYIGASVESLSSLRVPEPSTTYASVAAARPRRRPALHSVAVTSKDRQETAGEVLTRVEKAVDAGRTGLKISKARKAKNSVVILGCDTKEEAEKLKKYIESKGDGLVVEPMKNKDPLVVLKDVHADNDNDQLIAALQKQNAEIFMGLPREEGEDIRIKYKKRTRNPGASHIVLQVGPKAWQRMTAAGVLYLGLQRVRVEDQSPLIQCTRCLAFGHGRKFCTEGADRCSHCGGPHLRKDCADYSAGSVPRCCNCSHSGSRSTDHNAFSAECPVRAKWDYLARETTAYP